MATIREKNMNNNSQFETLQAVIATKECQSNFQNELQIVTRTIKSLLTVSTGFLYARAIAIKLNKIDI